jgi:hypothetical protein
VFNWKTKETNSLSGHPDEFRTVQSSSRVRQKGGVPVVTLLAQMTLPQGLRRKRPRPLVANDLGFFDRIFFFDRKKKRALGVLLCYSRGH